MIRASKAVPIAGLALLGLAACHGDFLTGGDLSNDPNRPGAASATQLFTGVQSNLWSEWGSDLSRVTSMWTQQMMGLISQYISLYDYQYDESATGGFQGGLYSGGGLIDLKKIDSLATKANDKHMLGISEIMEGALMGTGADLFGDLVYSQALSGKPNPPLDDQLAVYDSVQKVLAAGITNMASNNPTDVGPGSYDLNYAGDPTAWTKLAHTLKARFYMHTAKVNTNAYALALADAQQGLDNPNIDYKGVFSATPQAATNFWYQFNGPAGRGGYIGVQNTNTSPPSDTVYLARFLAETADPRYAQYYDTTLGNGTNYLSSTRGSASYAQPYVTTTENLLIWAEAAYRTGDQATALAKFNQERALNGLAPSTASSGQPLLLAILTEEYVNDFQLGEEAWNLYKRTCWPNLAVTVPGKKIPRRFYYDTGERQTNKNIPSAGSGINGAFNPDDPPLSTSADGSVCLGQ